MAAKQTKRTPSRGIAGRDGDSPPGGRARTARRTLKPAEGLGARLDVLATRIQPVTLIDDEESRRRAQAAVRRR